MSEAEQRRTEQLRFQHVDTEARLSTGLVQAGLDAVGDLDSANDFCEPALQLLAQGLERFTKLTYVLAREHVAGEHTTQEELKPGKGFGHNLPKVTKALVALAERCPSYTSRPQGRADLEVVHHDGLLPSILQLLGDFAKWGRYYRLNGVLDPHTRPEDDPAERWQQIEGQVFRARPELEQRLLSAPEQNASAWAEVIGELQLVIGGHAGAVARMWTRGVLGSNAKSHTPSLSGLHQHTRETS